MELEVQNSQLEPAPALKRCPRCEESLPLLGFGVCRARPDGRNLYCKRCIREKINNARIALREYKAATRKRLQANPRMSERVVAVLAPEPRMGRPSNKDFRTRIRRLPAPGRIILSLSEIGPQTYGELCHSCRLHVDDLGEALADVIEKRVISKNGTGPRKYFLKPTPKQMPPIKERLAEPALSFGTRLGSRQLLTAPVVRSASPDKLNSLRK